MYKEQTLLPQSNLITHLSSSISAIFDLDNPNEYDESLQYCFKALIFDDTSYYILTPMLKVYSLRKHNICFYMNIKDSKNRMSDIIGIYLLKPTQDNFTLIKNDLNNHIFDNFYINFIDFDVNDTEIKEFFNEIAQCDNYNLIYKFNICPIDFCIYHPNIFSLNISRPFLLLNSPNVSEEKTQAYFNDVSNGLFSMLFTSKMIPIVKYRNGSWLTEQIIKNVQEKYNKSFEKFPELREEFPHKKNSMLIIVDRETDIPIMLHHAYSYGSIINDITGISRSSTSSDQKFELDPINDFIWNENINKSFDEVGNIIYKETKNNYDNMKFLDKISKPKGINELVQESEQLAASIESLRDNKIISNILTQESNSYKKVKEEQKKRQFDIINEIEASILSKRQSISSETKIKVMEFIRGFKVVTNESKHDLYRLILIYYLCNQSISQNEEREIEGFLQEKCNVTNQLIRYIKDKKNKKGTNTGSSQSSYFQSGLNYFVNSIGSLMTIEQPSIIAGLINTLVINKDFKGFNTYNFYKKSIESVDMVSDYKDIIIFVIGGGCLAEYECINELLEKSQKNVIYGCDQLYRQSDFLDDLIQLSK